MANNGKSKFDSSTLRKELTEKLESVKDLDQLWSWLQDKDSNLSLLRWRLLHLLEKQKNENIEEEKIFEENILNNAELLELLLCSLLL